MAAKSFDDFPSLGLPDHFSWLRSLYRLPQWLAQWPRVLFACWPILLVPTASIGFLTTVLVRPTHWRSDFALGVQTGLAAGAVFYVLLIGPAVLLTTVLVPQVLVLTTLDHEYTETAQAASPSRAQRTGTQPAGPIVPPAYFADLATLPATQRAGKVASKIMADMIVGIFAGIWLGALFSTALWIGLCLPQALAAGYLLRREGQWKSTVVPYVELSGSWGLLATFAAAALFHGEFLSYVSSQTGVPFDRIVFSLGLLLALCLLATLGVVRRWSILLRWSLYASWFATVAALTGIGDGSFVGVRWCYLGMGVSYSAVVLLALLHALEKRSRTAAS